MSVVVVTLPAEAARHLAAAVAPAMGKDEITPIITGAFCSVTEGQIELTATDRYRVHRIRRTAATTGTGVFLIPGPVIRWLQRNSSIFGRRALLGTATVRLTFTPEDLPARAVDTTSACPSGRVVIEVLEFEGIITDSVSYTGTLIKGIYPGVARLFDQAKPDTGGEARLRTDFLAGTSHMAVDRSDIPHVTFTASENPNKPGPVLLRFEHGEALIQPNLPTPR